MDPLFADGVDALDVLIVAIKVVVIFVIMLTGVLVMIWWERRLVAFMQNRLGPNRVGPGGFLQQVADGVKGFLKEVIIPARAERRLFVLAPFLTLIPAFLTFSVIPIGGNFMTGDGTVEIFGRETFLQLADPPVGVLFVIAMSAISVYGVMLAGWASGSKYPLLGSVRATAQMISYEAAFSLAVVTVVLVAGSLSVHEIVVGQAPYSWNLWITGIVPFVIFVVAGTAELNRPPFDLVEAESELTGGYFTEYSSTLFLYYYLAEFLNTVTMSALIVTFFLGGPTGPAPIGPEWIWSIGWFALKTFLLMSVFVWFRATLPRFRYDQLMDLGWKVMIPLALGWFLLIGAIRVGSDQGWNLIAVTGISFVVLLGGWGLLVWGLRVSHRARVLEEASD